MQCPNCGYEFEGGQRCPACDTHLGQQGGTAHSHGQGNQQGPNSRPPDTHDQQQRRWRRDQGQGAGQHRGQQPQGRGESGERRQQRGQPQQSPQSSQGVPPQQGGQNPQGPRGGGPPQQGGQGPQGPPGGGPPQQGNDGIDRRTFVLGGAGALVVAGGGWYFFLRGDDPESAVETYFDAVDAGNPEQAEAVVHPDSDINVYVYEDDADEFDIDIHELEERGVREALREQWDIEGEDLDDEVERTEENLEDLVDEHGLDDYAYVYYDATISAEQYDDYEIDGHMLTVDDGGDWYIWVFGLY